MESDHIECCLLSPLEAKTTRRNRNIHKPIVNHDHDHDHLIMSIYKPERENNPGKSALHVHVQLLRVPFHLGIRFNFFSFCYEGSLFTLKF